MRDWEKRLKAKRKQKLERIAGRIVEAGLKFEPKIDFSPTFMKKLRTRRKRYTL